MLSREEDLTNHGIQLSLDNVTLLESPKAYEPVVNVRKEGKSDITTFLTL